MKYAVFAAVSANKDVPPRELKPAVVALIRAEPSLRLIAAVIGKLKSV